MSIPRERTAYTTRNGGTCGRFTWRFDPSSGEQVPSHLDFCRDNRGDGDNYPLDIEHHEFQGGRINLRYNGYFDSWFNDWVSEILRPSFNMSHLGTDSYLLDSAYATNAVARTNPSRPGVDTPREIAELRDLSRVMRDRGAQTHYGRVGQMFLGHTFGTLPILSTISDLLNSQKAIESRRHEIQTLVSRGINRTLTMGSYSNTARDYRYIDTAHATIGGWFDTTTKEEVRCHVRWRIAENAFAANATPDHIKRVIDSWASRSVLGATIDLSTAYELLPWSWLADWFGSTGDYLVGCRNIIPATMLEVVVMRHRRTESSFPGADIRPNPFGPVGQVEAISMKRETKSRKFSFASPFAAHIPAIDAGRAGILASLAVTRHSAF